MKKYESPLAELVGLETRDVITFSFPDSNAKYDDCEDANNVPGWFM